MSNGAQIIRLPGANGLNGPQGPTKLPTLGEFLSALRGSKFSSVRKLAVVYNPRSGLGQIKSQLSVADDKTYCIHIAEEIFRRELLPIEDVRAHATSPDNRERLIAAACPEVELDLLANLILDNEERVSEVAEETFYARDLSPEEVTQIQALESDRITEVLQFHDSFLEHPDNAPAPAEHPAEREAEEGDTSWVLELLRMTKPSVGQHTKKNPNLLAQLDSPVEQTAATVILFKLVIKPDKTIKDYWTLMTALQQTEDETLASQIAHQLHRDLFAESDE
jgi:hypothetical protein